jgi:predicted transglutaminase-like cysteine proteinase
MGPNRRIGADRPSPPTAAVGAPHWLRLLLLLLAAQLALAAPAIADAFQSEGVFGQSGKRFNNFRPIPKWPKLLERYRAEERKDQRCRASGRNRCPYDEWKRTIERLRNKNKAAQVREINEFANNWDYITDPVNWGQEDYWATPGEFFRKAGDCEDYAIVKFMSLRALGFSNDELRLAVVDDLNLDVPHSVTLVELYGRVMLLDNQIKRVVPAKTVRHYKPVFAANEDAWWLYQ